MTILALTPKQADFVVGRSGYFELALVFKVKGLRPKNLKVGSGEAAELS